jgi:hypothetical protein
MALILLAKTKCNSELTLTESFSQRNLIFVDLKFTFTEEMVTTFYEGLILRNSLISWFNDFFPNRELYC